MSDFKRFVSVVYAEAIPGKFDEEDGYFVKDDKNPYAKHWVAKRDFEKTFKPCDSAIDRLVNEMEDLEEKADKLESFVESDEYAVLDANMQRLLLSQMAVMDDYWQILDERLALMAEDEE